MEKVDHGAACPLFFVTLKPPSPLFPTPACECEDLPIIFLFIGDDGNVKVRLVAKRHIVRTLRTLQPLSELLLRTSFTKVAKERSFLFITMLILKDRSHLFTS